jgi:ABC-2 type transport system permease protein
MLAPVVVRVRYHAGSGGRGARIVALVAVGLVLYGVFMGMAYMLASVTAEKQLRVTEQVVSAISPQAWIDGKILGIAAVSLVNILIFAAGGVLYLAGRALATGSAFSLGAADPAAVVWIVLFALLGFLFWLAAFGAVAATIDDPNTSTRGPIMFIPVLFSGIGFMIVPNPDSTFARVAGFIPLSAPSVMPARVALSEVPLWELLLSVALLVAGIAALRRAAGKVFATAMLMYGKEPSWGEMRRWVREG